MMSNKNYLLTKKDKNNIIFNHIYFLSILLGATTFSFTTLGNSATAQFTCNDRRLGTDTREKITPEETRRGTNVVIGTDCNNANFNEYLDRQGERDLEKDLRRMELQREESLQREREYLRRQEESALRQCQVFGADHSFCTHPEYKREAQKQQQELQNQELERQQERRRSKRETELRQNIIYAENRLDHARKSLAIFQDDPNTRARYEQEIKLAEEKLSKAQQELTDFLNR